MNGKSASSGATTISVPSSRKKNPRAQCKYENISIILDDGSHFVGSRVYGRGSSRGANPGMSRGPPWRRETMTGLFAMREGTFERGVYRARQVGVMEKRHACS